MLEVKTDALEESFEALEREDGDLAALKEEVAALRGRIEARERPPLSGTKAIGGAGSPFVEPICARASRPGRAEGAERDERRRGRLCRAEELDEAIARTSPRSRRSADRNCRQGRLGRLPQLVTPADALGWVSRIGAAETGHPAFEEIAPPFGELYANPAGARRCSRQAVRRRRPGGRRDRERIRPGRGRGLRFGRRISKPKGFLSHRKARSDSARAFGTLQSSRPGSRRLSGGQSAGPS